MGALTLREQAVEKAAYQRGWNDREADFLAGVERTGMVVVSAEEAATLAGLRDGSLVAVPRKMTRPYMLAMHHAVRNAISNGVEHHDGWVRPLVKYRLRWEAVVKRADRERAMLAAEQEPGHD